MSTDFFFTKDNLDHCLRELGKEFRKRGGKQAPAEIILIGGAAVLVGYGFRDMTYDVDAVIQAASSIKDAINTVSGTRGDLGAIQNRLEHTQNNLSVMTENIQDAESTIRDTDVADEMMAYTKNNILVQSAQAMLAQANQVPQGVLQLLQ